jgi:hypothetical protein
VSRTAGQTWLFRVQLPPGTPHGGRLMARVLKSLWRAWGIRCTAVVEAPPQPGVAVPGSAPAASGTVETANPSSSTTDPV